MPPRETIRHNPETAAWLGRVSAAIENWDPQKSPVVEQCLAQFFVINAQNFSQALSRLLVLINQARHDLYMQIPGAGSFAIEQGMIYDYFDGIRKIIELAKQDHPLTKTNWEGTGVEPDVKVPAADALATAEKLAMEKLQEKKASK